MNYFEKLERRRNTVNQHAQEYERYHPRQQSGASATAMTPAAPPPNWATPSAMVLCDGGMKPAAVHTRRAPLPYSAPLMSSATPPPNLVALTPVSMLDGSMEEDDGSIQQAHKRKEYQEAQEGRKVFLRVAVGRCSVHARPRLESTWFQNFNLTKRNCHST